MPSTDITPPDSFTALTHLQANAVEAKTNAFAVTIFADNSPDAFIHVHGLGWYFYTGFHWEPDDGDKRVINWFREKVPTRLRDLAVEAGDQAAASGAEDQVKMWQKVQKDYVSAALRYADHYHIREALKLAATDARFSVDLVRLDGDGLLLNTRSGTLDLRTGDLRPHDPKDRITHLTAATYNPDATCPNWLKFLELVQPDPEMRAFLQRAAGQGLIGRRTEDILNLYGPTAANGKTTFQDTLRLVLGTYGGILPPHHLMATGGKPSVSEKAELANLRGARWVTSSELGEGWAMNAAFLKSLSDTELVAEFKFKSQFRFQSNFTLAVATNYLMKVSGTDEGIFRRVHVVPFDVRITDPNPHYLEDVLLPEQDGILAWAVQGALDYLSTAPSYSLMPPESVREASQAYKTESDVVGRFIDDELHFGEYDGDGEIGLTSVSALKAAFRDYAMSDKRYAGVDPNDLIRRIEREHGLKRKRARTSVIENGVAVSRNVWCIPGVRLLSNIGAEQETPTL